MSILLDAILILIVAICIFLAVKKGFVRSLVEVVGYILAIVIAFSTSGMIADYIYDNSVKTVLIDSVSTAIEENSDKAIEQLPDYLVTILENTDIDVENLFLSTSSDSVVIAEQISTAIEPIVAGIIKTIVTVIIFLILLVVVKLLAKIVNSMFKGAILGTANKLLGVAIGAAKGVVFASVFCMIVYFVSSVSTGEFLFFTSDTIDKSYLAKYVIDFILGKF